MSSVRYRPAVGVSARRFGDDVVVLDVIRGVYFSINAVGTHIWEALLAGGTLDEIQLSVVAQFNVEEDTARQDVAVFVANLCRERLLEVLDKRVSEP